MNIEDLMVKIYKLFEKSSDTPDKTSEDYIVRLEYVNSAISDWANEEGIQWKELFGTITDTLTNGVFDLTTITDFKHPAGFVIIGGVPYEYVRPEEVEQSQRETPSKKIYTVTGSEGSYKLLVYPIVSGDFTLNYRKTPTTYSTGEETTPIQMSDPYYIIHAVIMQLYLDDDNTTQASVEQQIADNKMEAMKLANETVPFLQDDKIPDDNDAIIFGE